MKEGEFCINALANIPAAYSFPFGYSVGLSCDISVNIVKISIPDVTPSNPEITLINYTVDYQEAIKLLST